MDWKWILTTILASYGAILSTARELAARRDKQINLKVNLRFDAATMAGDGTPPDSHLQVSVENHGGVNLIFNSNVVSLNIDGYRPYTAIMNSISDVKFPCVLSPGMSFYLIKEMKLFLPDLKTKNLGNTMKVRAMVQDAINRSYYSEWVVIRLSDQ